MRTLFAVVAIALSAASWAQLYEPMNPPFVTWVADGEARAQILTDEFAEGTIQPADILNEYIEKITGVRLPVVEEAQGGAPTVYLGPISGLGRIKQFGYLEISPEGFVIHSDGDDVIIAGRNRLATIYGVCAFLEECLGVRWFWPGETGEYVPTGATLRVGQVRKIDNPDFRYRWVGRADWALRNRMNVGTGQPDEFRTKWFVHTFLNLVPPDRYWEEHPEYYALRGDVRQDPTNRSRQVQLCTSNPQVAPAVAQTIDEIVAEDPGLKMISVDPMDSQNFCQCANCAALDEPDTAYPQRYSRRLVLFYNQVAELVAEKHPDLLLKSIAYHTYVAPPRDPDLRVHDNVVIQFCRFECHNHPLHDPNCPTNEAFNRHFVGWSKIAKNVIFYEYYWKVSWLHLPWPIAHMLKDDIPYLRDQSLTGVATQYTSNFGTHALGYYVAAKLLWDADLDVDALVQDFCDKAYAEAAEPMADYHSRLERAAIESRVHLAGQRPYADVLRLFTPAVLADLDNAITRARAAAQDDQAKARIEMARQGLEYTHMVVDYLQTVADVRSKMTHDRWLGAITPELREEARRVAGPKAEAIRQYLEDNQDSSALGSMNNYIAIMLKPEDIIGAWRESWQEPEGVRLTKADWLRDHPQELSHDWPAEFDLWVYGNDLDFVEGRPEHTVLARTGDGQEVVLGHVATEERNGNRISRAYIIERLKPGLLEDGTLHLIATNEEGGPYMSRFFAFYVMPKLPDTDADAATKRIEADLDWVRARAFGFAEYNFSGLLSGDGERDPVDLELEGVPTVE